MTLVAHIFGVLAAASLLVAGELERRGVPRWVPLVLVADSVLAGVTALVIWEAP